MQARGEEWKKLGEGSFNVAYVNADKTKVLKIPKEMKESRKDYKTDEAERAVRVWNEINPHVGTAELCTVIDPETKKEKAGWISPYIDGEQASDEEIQAALIDIYNRTGRIIVDATSHKNFVKKEDGQIVCIDIGMALQLEKREEDCYKRRKSIVSIEFWKNMWESYEADFEKNEEQYPKATKTIQALLLIKTHRPYIYDATFLLETPQLIHELATVYVSPIPEIMQSSLEKVDSASVPSKGVGEGKVPGIVERVDSAVPPDFEQIKKACIDQLNKYIESRDEYKRNKFKSLLTNFFKGPDLTEEKASIIPNSLRAKIPEVSSLDELKKVLETAFKEYPKIKTGLFSKARFAICIQNCLDYVKVAKLAMQKNQQSNFKLGKEA